TIANPKGELKAITTRSGLVIEGPTIPNPPKSINLEEDECVEETYTDPDHAEDEMLTLNMKHDTANYSNHPYRESVKLITIFNLSSEDCLKDLDSHKQSGNPTLSLHNEIASPKVIPEIHDSKGCSFLSEELPDIDSF
nr:hypothetical protein [Tanacetum cinerariifolium]